jgi:hypothetical protein
MLETLPIGTKDDNWFQDQDPIFTISPDTRRKHIAPFSDRRVPAKVRFCEI